MAIAVKQVVSKEKVFQCDRCGKTKPISLSNAFMDVKSGYTPWRLTGDDKVLCSDCLNTIVDSWYNQKDVNNFQLKDDMAGKDWVKRPGERLFN